MKENIKIEGYSNKWSAIDQMVVNFNQYYLMENNTYGDETCYLVIDSNNKVICETFDDLYTALKDESIIES